MFCDSVKAIGVLLPAIIVFGILLVIPNTVSIKSQSDSVATVIETNAEATID